MRKILMTILFFINLIIFTCTGDHASCTTVVGMTHGRDTFAVMDAVTTSFSKQNRLSMSKSLAIFLVVLFIACLVGTGLLVYHLSSCTHSSKNVIEKVEISNRTPIDLITTTSLVEEFVGSTSTISPINADVTEPPIDSKIIDVRLPTSIEPHSYEIKFVPFIVEGNFTFHGEVNILVNVTKATDNITFHADELTIDESSVLVYEVITDDANNVINRSISVREISNDTERQFLIIYLKTQLEPGKQYNIYIKYVGILNDLLQGFYRSSYMIENQIRWIAATQFQPTDARRAFPCFDEPALKAKFKISLARFTNMSTISNMRRLSTEPFKGLEDYVWDHYEESIPMSTYLIAFVVSDFEYIKNGNFAVWTRRDALPQAKHSLDVGPKILKFFEDYFQIAFPLPKVDMIALPDFAAGAMENWGLITYRETALLYEDGVSSRTNLQRITTVIAHELAHQWFGNLVTPKWWTDLWLNEGFASYMEYIGTNAVKPAWKIMDQFVVHELQNVLALDGLKSSHQISIKVNNPNEINDIFDRISYAKGATIIRMMEHFLTAEVFRTGLTNYLNSRKYSSAEQDDLWFALTEQAHKDGVLNENVSVKEIMDTWTLQTGFPVVSVIRGYDENFASLKQERFSLENYKNETTSPLWWIPITYTSKANDEMKSTWMSAEAEIVLSDLRLSPTDWLLVNVEQRGYYRVNYDHRNWQLLTQQLLDKNGFLKFKATNRAQMLDDSFNLAAAGYLDYDIALNVTKYLVHERECVPWMAAFTGLDYLQEMFMKSANFDKFKIYMMSLMDGLYKDVGFEDSSKDSQLTVYNRIDVLWRSCLLGNLDCVRNAVTHFHNWRSSPNPDLYNPISPNLKNVVYCMAIRAGGQEEWDFAWQRYLNSNVGSEKELILSALGCSRETWLLSRYLHWAVTEGSGIRKQDSARVFTSVSNNIIGQELAYRFFKNNWDSLKKYMGSSLLLLNAIVKTATSKFNTQEELDDLKQFVKHNEEELSIVSRTLEQSIEQGEANVRWMNKNYHKIVRWLSEFQASVQYN